MVQLDNFTPDQKSICHRRDHHRPGPVECLLRAEDMGEAQHHQEASCRGLGDARGAPPELRRCGVHVLRHVIHISPANGKGQLTAELGLTVGLGQHQATQSEETLVKFRLVRASPSPSPSVPCGGR